MISLEHTSCIIFDLGGVILDIDYSKTSEAFYKLGFTDFDDFYHQNKQSELFSLFEIGKMTPQQFRHGVRQLANANYTDLQIDDAWCCMLGQFRESVIPLLKALKANFKLVLFSNTNEIHYQRVVQSIHKNYNTNMLEILFDNLYFSHQLHARKPDPSAFQAVLKQASAQAHNTIFIDDTKRHVRGAEAIGIRSYWLEKGRQVTDLFPH